MGVLLRPSIHLEAFCLFLLLFFFSQTTDYHKYACWRAASEIKVNESREVNLGSASGEHTPGKGKGRVTQLQENVASTLR